MIRTQINASELSEKVSFLVRSSDGKSNCSFFYAQFKSLRTVLSLEMFAKSRTFSNRPHMYNL